VGALLSESVQRMNAAKNFLTLVENIVAAVSYTSVAFNRISWPAAGLIAAGPLVGGLVGARYGRRLSPNALRATIMVVGLIGLCRLLTVQGHRLAACRRCSKPRQCRRGLQATLMGSVGTQAPAIGSGLSACFRCCWQRAGRHHFAAMLAANSSAERLASSTLQVLPPVRQLAIRAVVLAC
jgi:hypothetical protein